MRLALLSDIHGNLAALEAVAADLRCRGVDQVVNLGDSLSGPLLPRETAQFLMTQGWLHLAGNHERQLLAQRAEQMGPSDAYAFSQLTTQEFDWIGSLPSSVRLSPDVFLCHGSPRSDVEYFLETLEEGVVRQATAAEVETRLATELAPLVACGHTHVARVVHTRRGQRVVNFQRASLMAADIRCPTCR